MYRLGRGVTKSKRKRIALIKCIGDGPFARRVIIRVSFSLGSLYAYRSDTVLTCGVVDSRLAPTRLLNEVCRSCSIVDIGLISSEE